jgi:ectoine hydroxylase-related dioxygenase (phytanoyl-CoA dioxygenase family)
MNLSLKQLEADGFVVVEAAVSRSHTDVLIRELADLGARFGLRNLLRDAPAVTELAAALIPCVTPVLGAEAFAVRGLFFDKLSGANWDVGWHQDLSIAVAERQEAPGFGGWSIKKGVLHVQPPASILEQMLTVRVHLDDCDADNGPLRVLRGSHRHGRLTEEAIEAFRRQGEEMTCLVRQGGIVLLRPLLLHASSRARRPSHRRVVHLEYAAVPLPHGLRWYEQVRAQAQGAGPS